MNHQINIQMRLDISPDVKGKRLTEIEINELTALASSSFRHINLLSAMLENGDITQLDFLRAANTLSQLGEAVVNAIETTCQKNLFSEANKDEK